MGDIMELIPKRLFLLIFSLELTKQNVKHKFLGNNRGYYHMTLRLGVKYCHALKSRNLRTYITTLSI